MQKISIDEFIAMKGKYPLVDVRSPAEYSHAHVPGAYNVPLFSDDERAVVGTLYKQQGREQAIKQGLKYFGPKMVVSVEPVNAIAWPRTAPASATAPVSRVSVRATSWWSAVRASNCATQVLSMTGS